MLSNQMPNIAISIRNLSKKYRIDSQQHDTLRDQIMHLFSNPVNKGVSNQNTELWALKQIDLQIMHGEVVGIIGRNGAGKSTLFKILSRITAPTTGKVEIYGRVGSLLEVGTGFHAELTGRENILMNGAILGMGRNEIKRKFDEILNFAGIEKFVDTPVKRYSSGMYVRLAFAVAAHLEPEILLVDEVLAVGDVAFQRKCLGKMSDIAQEGRTVLFVSHNMSAIQTLCNRGIYLDYGKIIIDDEINRVVAVYLNSLEKSVTTQISQRTDRTGRGEIRLVDIKITSLQKYAEVDSVNSPQSEIMNSRQDTTNKIDADTWISQTLSTGQPAKFEFYLTEVHPDIVCTFTVFDQNGVSVCFFRSSMVGPDDEYLDNSGNRIVCIIDELLLLPGKYRLRVEIDRNFIKEDFLEAAIIFSVEQGQLHKRPTYENNQYGSITMPHRWQFPYSLS
jgi:lipopolysaccharide transport system ATP-binding protein